MRFSVFLLVCSTALSGSLYASSSAELKQVLARLDKASGEFKSMTAQVNYVTHTEVLNDDSKETGLVTMKKVQAGEVQGRVDFSSPDVRMVTFEKRRFQEYLPKIKTLRVFDLDKHGEQLDKFLMLGFGTSGAELAKDYDVTITGADATAVHLQLVPRAGEAKQYIQKVDLWLPIEGDPYPLREKIFEPSGDYRLVTYTNVKINAPLAPDAMQLKLPAGYKTEYPGK